MSDPTRCWADVTRTTAWGETVTQACDALVDAGPVGLCPTHAHDIVPGAPEPPALEPYDPFGWLPYDDMGGYISVPAYLQSVGWGGAAA